jgi:hypothetical protein
MTIHALGQKIKREIGERKQTLVFGIILVFTAFLSFYIGYIARVEGLEKAPKPLNLASESPIATSAQKPAVMESERTDGAYVASKNGTKYYPKGCSGAKRIKEENRVFFATASKAESEGYTLASGC